MGGMDWRSVGWVEYQTALEAWNMRHSDEKPAPYAEPGGGDRMRRALAAAQAGR